MIRDVDWQSESLQREILDLQSEFEFDRIDYLDTIRKQEQQNRWLQAVIDRVIPVIRRDCNYVNLEKIRSLSEWDENNQVWVLPKLTIEKTHLPPAGKIYVVFERVQFYIQRRGLSAGRIRAFRVRYYKETFKIYQFMVRFVYRYTCWTNETHACLKVGCLKFRP